MFVFRSTFFFQAEDGIRDHCVTGVQTCALPISAERSQSHTHVLEQLHRGATRAAGNGRAELTVVDHAHQHLDALGRSEERRVGKECRSWWSAYEKIYKVIAVAQGM